MRKVRVRLRNQKAVAGKTAVMIYADRIEETTDWDGSPAPPSKFDFTHAFILHTNGGAAGATNFVLPDAISAHIGLEFFFEVVAAQQVTIATGTSADKINGRGASNADSMQSNVVNRHAVLNCIAVNQWQLTTRRGTWTFA